MRRFGSCLVLVLALQTSAVADDEVKQARCEMTCYRADDGKENSKPEYECGYTTEEQTKKQPKVCYRKELWSDIHRRVARKMYAWIAKYGDIPYEDAIVIGVPAIPTVEERPGFRY